MSGGYFGDAGLFLVDTVFRLYILIVLLRFLFQLTGVDFYNSISQFLVKASNPPLRPLRRVVPGLLGIDFSCVVLLVVLTIIWIALTGGSLNIKGLGFLYGYTPRPIGLLVSAIAYLLKLTIWIFVYAIFGRAISSWITTTGHHPILRLLHSLTEPLMAPARRILPATSGLDLSPIIVFIVLMLIQKLLVQPLLDLGTITL
jgi:YggT family protein